MAEVSGLVAELEAKRTVAKRNEEKASVLQLKRGERPVGSASSHCKKEWAALITDGGTEEKAEAQVVWIV